MSTPGAKFSLTWFDIFFYTCVAILLSALFFIVLFRSSSAWGAGSSWTDGMSQLQSDIGGLSSSCRAWVEEYGTGGGSFRSWKRCGAGAVQSGGHILRFMFPMSFSVPGSGKSYGGVVYWQSPDGAPGYRTYNSGDSGYGGASFVLDSGGNLQMVYGTWDKISYNWTCTGAKTNEDNAHYTGSDGTASAPVLNSSGNTSPDLTTCKTYDSLLRDMGPLIDNCDYSATVKGNVGKGKFLEGACGCVPMRYGVIASTATSCMFTPNVGDPASTISFPVSNVGATETGRGASTHGTFSQLGTGSGGGSLAEGYNTGTGSYGTGTNVGWGVPESGTGSGGGLSPGDIYRSVKQALQDAGGGGLTEGQTKSAVKGALDDEVGGAGVPSGGSYAGYSSGDAPTQATWISTITGFLSSSPLVTIFTGTHFSLSGSSCSFSTSYSWGGSHTLTFDFCNSAYSAMWTLIGAGMVVASYIAAIYIIIL